MRSRIIDLLNEAFHTASFEYLVPDPSVVYAVMLGVGAFVFVRRCGKAGLSQYHAAGIAMWASLAALVGARLFYLLQHIGDAFRHPEMLLELNGATVSFGVYLGGVGGAFLYAGSHHLAIWKYLDAAASVLGIGPLVGRMACFLNGDDYGTLSNGPWAMRFPHGSYPFLNQVEHGWISPMDDLSLPVHPVQLYGCGKGLMLFILFSYVWKKNPFKPGVLFFLYWIAYALCRFTLEFFRGDEDRGWIGNLSTGQFLSLVILCSSLLGAAVLCRWQLRNAVSSNGRTTDARLRARAS